MLGNKINFIIICSVLCALLAYIFLPQFQPTTRQFNEIQNNSIALPSDRVHIFYYIWYGNPKSDGEWIHWNHKVLPHWHAHVNKKYPQIGTKYTPDTGSIGATFFPARGLYSSSDEDIIFDHFQELHNIGVGVVVVSWWGRWGHDDDGINGEFIIPRLMKCAEKAKIKVAFHLEPYKGRTALNVRDDIVYLINTYGNSTAFYRSNDGKPMFYVYDPYHIPTSEWKNILGENGNATIRKTIYDSVMISLYLDHTSQDLVVNGNFDGIYTYFAATGFTYGSTPQNWKSIQAWCKKNQKLFIVSVGPGYNDLRIRPWNEENKRDRRDGAYYDEMWKSALELEPEFVSITSFNEWGEGTQIESAVPKEIDGFVYENYLPYSPNYYMEKTKFWILKLLKNSVNNSLEN